MKKALEKFQPVDLVLALPVLVVFALMFFVNLP